jgi:hypothetical protein
MGWAGSKYEGKDTCIQQFDGGNLRARDHLEDPGVDGRVLKWIVKTFDGVWSVTSRTLADNIYIYIYIYPSLAPESSSPRRTRESDS